MTQSQLVKEIIKLSLIAEELGCQPIQEIYYQLQTIYQNS